MTQTTGRRKQVAALALAGAGLGLMMAQGAGAAGQPEVAPGAWQAHKVDFVFMGFTSTYSCDGLADGLKALLSEAGANKGLKVNPLCTRGPGQPEKMAEAVVTFETLQPVADVPASTASAAPPAAVPGAWRHVEFSWHKPLSVQPNDCELVEQFADKLLPMFTTRNVQRHITCVPGQDSRLSFDLQFDVFAMAPREAGPAAR